jgi:hypothetical protein
MKVSVISNQGSMILVLLGWIWKSGSLSDWRSAFVDLVQGVGKLLIISLSNLLYSCFAIESLSNGFICLHKLVKFFRQLIILVSNDSDVVVEGVDFNLEVGVVVQKC